MSILSDRTLAHLIASTDLISRPYKEISIQPASIEMHLDSRFIDRVGTPDQTLGVEEGHLHVAPKDFLLASTEEWVHIPDRLVGRVEGKSSWARRGLAIHVTAGFIDPGFRGVITLELVNHSTVTVTVPIGAPIAQLTLMELDKPAARPYGSPGLGSHYQGQDKVTPSTL